MNSTLGSVVTLAMFYMVWVILKVECLSLCLKRKVLLCLKAVTLWPLSQAWSTSTIHMRLVKCHTGRMSRQWLMKTLLVYVVTMLVPEWQVHCVLFIEISEMRDDLKHCHFIFKLKNMMGQFAWIILHPFYLLLLLSVREAVKEDLSLWSISPDPLLQGSLPWPS